MNYEYQLNEEDFLKFQLFTASKSVGIAKKIKNNRIILALASTLMAILAYGKGNIAITIYLGLSAIALYFLYPIYFKWSYKKKSISSVKSNYGNQFGELASIKFASDHLFIKNKTGEGKVLLADITEINETKNYFFLKMSSGSSLILPKQNIEELASLKKKLATLTIKKTQELDWE